MTPTTDNVIRLADRRPGHPAGAVGSTTGPELDGLDGALGHSLLKTGGYLMVAALEIKKGKTDPLRASQYVWRIGQALEDMAVRADRLERKLRRAKRKAKRRG